MSTQVTQTRASPVALLMLALFFIWGLGYETVGRRLRIDLNGTIISSRDVPPSRGPRYVTEYTLRGPDGRDSTYTAGPTDASLPRSMPVGTYIRKEPGHFYYERNGDRVDDFPIPFYSLMLFLAAALLVWSLVVWRSQIKQHY